MFELLYTSAVIDTRLLGYSGFNTFYFMKSWVCLYYISKEDDKYLHIQKIFHDGTRILLDQEYPETGGGVYFDGAPIGREDGKVCSVLMISNPNRLRFLKVDEFLGMEQPEVLIESPMAGGLTYLILGTYLDTVQKLILQRYSNQVRCFDAVTGELLWSLVTGANYYTRYSWVGYRTVMQSNYNTGEIKFIYYDREVGQIKKSGKVDPCWGITYDCVNNVILALGNDKKLRVYHPTGLPVQLSNPVISPLPVQRCGSYNIEVQLLGDGGEPCEGWWINWYLMYGKGYMQRQHTLTDSEGKSLNVYLSPTDMYNLGDEKITAEVVI